jgi:hypothetical protein
MKRSTTLSAFALAALLTGTAAAQNPPAPPKPAKPAQSGMATHKPTHRVREAKPGLLKQAKISADSAERVAMAQVAGGTVTAREIEKQKGTLVYSFDIKVPGQEGYQEVTVDATTGAFVSNMHETAKMEKKEHKATTKKPVKPDTTKPPKKP